MNTYAYMQKRGMERSGEDLKAGGPSIVKFSYKFLLDVNSKAVPGGAQSWLEGGGRDVVGEGIQKGLKREKTQLYPYFSPPSLPPSSLSTAVCSSC